MTLVHYVVGSNFNESFLPRPSPYFRRQDLDVASQTVSHKLNPLTPLCAFSIMGKCNDDRCAAQHWRDIIMTPAELYLDLLAYQGESIQLNSFDKFDDQLKAAQAEGSKSVVRIV